MLTVVLKVCRNGKGTLGGMGGRVDGDTHDRGGKFSLAGIWYLCITESCAFLFKACSNRYWLGKQGDWSACLGKLLSSCICSCALICDCCSFTMKEKRNKS